MHMSAESLLVILLIGAIAGWLAGQIVQGTGFGLVGDIIIGIVGAFIASWLFPQLGLHLGAGIVAEIIAATIGAVLLLVIVRLVRRGPEDKGTPYHWLDFTPPRPQIAAAPVEDFVTAAHSNVRESLETGARALRYLGRSNYQ
jgi:uncharacterized membrane protein YeaQ/YmgE (transglycosylase-associated protein family)